MISNYGQLKFYYFIFSFVKRILLIYLKQKKIQYKNYFL